MKEVTIYTDGACKGNPGPGGYGCILLYTDGAGELHEKEAYGAFRRTTNNRMEIYAVIKALEQLKESCQVTVWSDSQYVVNAFNQGWLKKWQRFEFHKDAKRKEKVKNADLWQRLTELTEIHQVTFCWVKGHDENRYNIRCDQLAAELAMALPWEDFLEDAFYDG